MSESYKTCVRRQNFVIIVAGLAMIGFGILALVLGTPSAATPPPVAVPAPVTAPAPVPEGLRDGSVLFWQDGFLSKPICKRTDSHLAHAAILLDGYIYEAVPPRVHKVPLADYLKEMRVKEQKARQVRKNFAWFIIQPNVPYDARLVATMTTYAESQLGRPYMLRGWWKGHEVRGVFCSQFVANTLEQGGRIESANYRESPGSLYEKLEPLYQ